MLDTATIKQLNLNMSAKEQKAFKLMFDQLDKVMRWKQVPSMPENKRDSVARHTINAMHLAQNTIKHPAFRDQTIGMLLVHDLGEIVDEIAQGQPETKLEKENRHELEAMIAQEAITLAFAEADGKVAPGTFAERIERARQRPIDEAPKIISNEEQMPLDEEAEDWIGTYEQVESLEDRKNNPIALVAKLLDKMQGHLKYVRDSAGELSTPSKIRLQNFEKKIEQAEPIVKKYSGGGEALAEIKKSHRTALRHAGLENTGTLLSN